MRQVILILAGVGLALIAADQPSRVNSQDVGASVVVVGKLGVPVGEAVTISGKTVFPGKGSNYFHVDSVNGKRLQEGVSIDVDGIEHWALGTQAELRGHEKGVLDYTDIRKTGFSKNDRRFVSRQQLSLWFEPLEVVSPENLTIKRVRR